MQSIVEYPDGDRLPMSLLSKAVRRKIKRKEIQLNRKFYKAWKFTNRLSESFIFGRFGRLKEDNIIVTLAAYNNLINTYLTF